MLPTIPAPFHLPTLILLDMLVPPEGGAFSGLAPSPPGPPRKPRRSRRSLSSARRWSARYSSRYRRASEVSPLDGAGNQMDECVGGGPYPHAVNDLSEVGGGESASARGGACEYVAAGGLVRVESGTSGCGREVVRARPLGSSWREGA